MIKWSWNKDRLRRFDDWVGRWGMVVVLVGAILLVAIAMLMGGGEVK